MNAQNSDIHGFQDHRYHFKELFNARTGFYLRTGILKHDTKNDTWTDTGVDPFMRSMPALIDIGIMGTCLHGASGLCRQSGVECYQDGIHIREENMSLANFQKIIDQIKGISFQCALGGRGDPNKHESFAEILRCCQVHDIVPNYTTSGLDLTDREADITAEYVGAAAVSFYRHSHTLKAVQKFIRRGVKTNIHYVLSENSIDEVINGLTDDLFPEAINAVIFLLHKPVGLGSRHNVLKADDKRVRTFFRMVTEKRFPFKIGFDSCSVPGILSFAEKFDPVSIEACEGARFSCYISPDMKMTPCSFDQHMRYGIDLNTHTIFEAWNSRQFQDFRTILRHTCPDCGHRENCMGGCPLTPEVTLCLEKEVSNENQD
ncbi:SPASM domain-containing protein [Desulfobacterales bacterium HSG16]|nr:SPASM domain-containing protein [Desulfobacterales bacterium HSG16]